MNEVTLGIGLGLYFFIIIIIFLILFYLIGLNILPSIVLSLLIGIIFLSIMFPISQIQMLNSSDIMVSVYSIIYVITILIILYYILYAAMRDFKHNNVSPRYEKFVKMCTGAGCLNDNK